MEWKMHAWQWLAEVVRIPNKERATHLDVYAREVVGIAPGTLRKYARALAFLKAIKKVASRHRTGPEATKSDVILDNLSANELSDHLRMVVAARHGMIQAWDVDPREPWPGDRHCPQDQALSV